jgi:hypothetical protein
MTPTLTAFTGFVAWSLFLLVLMELMRARLVGRCGQRVSASGAELLGRKCPRHA